jgi:hypothetical protein
MYITPPSSEPKNKPSKKPAKLATCFTMVSFLGLFFDPENGSDMFLVNVS